MSSYLYIRVIAFAPKGIGRSYRDKEVLFLGSLDERIRILCPFLCVYVSDRAMRIFHFSMNSETIIISSNVIAKDSSTRLNWLDWMKAIGIWLIIYGHFFSLFDRYVYVFNVPLFFIISGFLCKKEADSNIFWRKLWFNLIVPLLIICTINYIIAGTKGFLTSDGNILPENPFLFYGKLIIGLHEAVGTFWFVYTLALLKIILQYTRRVYIHILWLIIFLVFAYIINNNDVDIEVWGINPFAHAWSITNVFVSYPFFVIGHYMRKWKDKISNYKANRYTFCWIVISLFLIFVCGHNHKYVYLYICGYGDSIILYISGGLAGTIFIYFISKVLENIHWSWITDISIGTTIILGFHEHLISIFRHFFKTSSAVDLLLSICIVLLFVPIIRLCKSSIPIIMGKYRLKK